MRVLMALPDKRVRGGPPSHLYLLRDSLVELGVDMREFLYGGREHDESVAGKVWGRLRDLLGLPGLVCEHRPDIVHFNSAYDRKGVLRDVFFVPLARLLGRRVVIKFHGSDLELAASDSVLWHVLSWFVIRGAHLVCVLSGEERRVFEERFPGGRFAVVKNALEFSRYHRTRDFRAEYGIPAGKPLLLFIARFIATKGLREVILALPQIRRRHDVHAVFIGDGPVRAENERLCREVGVEDCVTFTGYIPEEETVDAYLASDMLVFPSYHQEGMPMVIFHSLACGLPIITTRIRAAADWLEEGRNVLFVPPREPDRLTEAVVRLLDDPDLRERMSEAGRDLAQKFDREHVAREFLLLYESLNGRRSMAGTCVR